jgi:hypothetical protein
LNRRASRRPFFTPLRVEWLEQRQVLSTVMVEAEQPSYIEGQTAWFTFTLSEAAPKAIQLDLLLTGGPTGPKGFVLPISKGETSVRVWFPTEDNSTSGDGYTLDLSITGSSKGGPAGPFDSASTLILDDDLGGIFESLSGPSGPTGPVTVTFDEPPSAVFEGTPFVLTGTISPPGNYTINHSVDYDYGGCEFDPQTGIFFRLASHSR